MRIVGPNPDQRQFFLIPILSVFIFSLATNFAWGSHHNRASRSSSGLSISSVGPNSGPVAGGTTVIISGSSFSQSASVVFGGVPATSVAVVSSTELQAVTPAHASGTVNVAITEGSHHQYQSATITGGFTYTGTTSTSLGVSGASPAAGPTGGGTVVTITGKGFQAGATVAFGSSLSTAVTVASSTQINAMSPPESSGTVPITVTDPNAQSASLPSGFTYTSGPVVSSISPNSGPVMGGTTVKILGSGFQSGASVTFGGIASNSVTLVSSTEIQAVAPVSAAGTISISVTNADSQSATLASAFTYFHTVTLSWACASSGVSGFNVYRSSTSGGPYTRVNSNMVSGMSFSDNAVHEGQTYFYVTTAISGNNTESGYSNQARAIVPSP
jgi:IPT/TIG domain